MIHRQYPVALYVMHGCPYCKRAVQLLRKLGIPFKAQNIGNNANLAYKLYHETGSPTVPKIYIRGRFIGGSDQLQALAESGELLQAVGR